MPTLVDNNLKETDKELRAPFYLLPPWCRHLCSELQLDTPEGLERERAGKGKAEL